jgi:hypothetical protein
LNLDTEKESVTIVEEAKEADLPSKTDMMKQSLKFDITRAV